MVDMSPGAQARRAEYIAGLQHEFDEALIAKVAADRAWQQAFLAAAPEVSALRAQFVVARDRWNSAGAILAQAMKTRG
jgi:hypothetical protein